MYRWVLPLLTASTMMAAPIYSIVQIGGVHDSPTSISRNGNVTGLNTDTSTAWRYTGTFQNLGTFSGFDTVGLGINDAGKVAGYYNFGQRAAMWDGTAWVNLHSSIGGSNTQARDINDSGEITGTRNLQAFLRDASGTVTVITGMNNGFGINNASEIVGMMKVSGVDTAAFRDAAGTITNLGVNALDPAIIASQARAISEFNRYVAGFASFSSGRSGFLCMIGGTCSLVNGGFGSGTDLVGVNSSGLAVGQSGTTAIIHQGGISTALHTLIDDPSGTIRLVSGADINDNGQITALGYYLSNPNNRYSFLLTPITAVPEPATYAITALGLGVIALRRRRR